MADWWEAAPLAPSGGITVGTKRPNDDDKPKLTAGYRWADAAHTRQEPIPGGSADPNTGTSKDSKPTEFQSKSAYFLGRMARANAAWTSLPDSEKGPRGIGRQIFHDLAPDIENTYANSGERQVADQNVRDFIGATLRQESGAAINKDEFDKQYRIFFPMPGDGPEVIKQKALARQQAIEGFKVAAGPLAEGALANLQLEQPNDQGTPSGVTPPGQTPPGAPPTDKTGRTSGEALYDAKPEDPTGFTDMSAEQKTAYAQFWKANPKPSPQQLSQFLGSIGVPWVQEVDAQHIIDAVNRGEGYSTAIDRTSVLRAEINKQDALRGAAKEDAAEVSLRAGNPFSDEASGVGRGLSKLVQGENPIEGYKLGRDAERLRVEDARRQMGWTGTGLEIIGGLGTAGPGALSNSLRLPELVKQGAGQSALYGFGSGEGGVDSVTKGVSAGVAGGALAGVLGLAANRIAGPVEGAPLAEAALAENVRVPQALVTGSRRAINKVGALEANESTAPVIQKGLADTADDIETGVRGLGRGGKALDRSDAGELVRTSLKEVDAADKAANSRAYEAAEAIDGDPRIDPANMRAKLDMEISRLERTPGTNREALQELRRYRADIDGPVPLSALRDMKTAISDVQAGVSASPGQRRAARRMMSILEGTKDDIQKGLSPEAWNAYQAADKRYSEYREFVEGVREKFVGKDIDQLSGEQIFDRLKGALNSNGRALSALHHRLPVERSRDLAATFAESLGRRGPDEDFSTALFIQQARKLSNSARETLFGKSGAASFNNLLRLGRGLERFKTQINMSRTARGIGPLIKQQVGKFLVAVMGGGGFAAAGPIGGAGGVAAGVVMNSAAQGVSAIQKGLSARALMSPAVTRWLESVSKVETPRQAQEAMNRLATVISRNPSLSSELTPLHRWLTEAVSTPVAASETEQQGNGDDQR